MTKRSKGAPAPLTARLSALALLTATSAGLAAPPGPAAAAEGPAPPPPSAVFARGGPASGAAAAALAARADLRGGLRVIVGLSQDALPGGPSSLDGPEGRRRLAVAQRGLLRRVGAAPGRTAPGRAAPVEFATIPFLALEADPATLRRLLADGWVASVEEDVAVPPSLAQSVPLVRADAVWRQGATGAGHAVAVLDTGVDAGHPMLRGKVVAEACYSSRVADVSASLCPRGVAASTAAGSGRPCPASIGACFHGTHVAAIAAGATANLAGVARGARVVSVQVFSRFDSPAYCGPGPAPCVLSYTSDQIRALERVEALSRTLRIAAVNMSLGGGAFAGPCDASTPAMAAAIGRLRAAGVATVVASGNAGLTGLISTPACVSAAVAVASTTKADGVSPFSNLSAQVALAAPGTGITSAAPGGRYVVASGTSMAAPHVAGAFALMRSVRPTAGVDEILAALAGGPVRVARAGIVVPRIDALAAAGALRQAPPARRGPAVAAAPSPSGARAAAATSGPPR